MIYADSDKMKIKLAPPVKFVPWAIHHSYLGILIMIYGFTGLGQEWSYDIGIKFILLGGAILADDIVEHTITGSTPLRILFDKVISKLFI